MEADVRAPTSDPQQADHLCVLVHGLWGNPNHLGYVASSLREAYGEDKLHILNAKRNSGSFTYDGIELGGERVAQEIEECLDELARSGQIIHKLSVVGYSLGGLVARYAIGLLYHKGYFDRLEAVNFTTFVTPHLGVRTPLLGTLNNLWNVLGARTLSTSGRQLFTIDSFRSTGRPLLSVLADPDSIFMRGLAKFRNRVVYANVVNDRSAVYYTTGISRTDPFANMNEVQINYVKGYEPVVIDSEAPVQPAHPQELPAFYKRIAGESRTLLRRLPMTLLLVILIPIGSAVFLLNSVVQTMRSRQRIRLHEEGKAGISLGGYRVPLMLQDVQSAVEDAYESMNAGQTQEYLPDGSEEMTESSEDSYHELSLVQTDKANEDNNVPLERPASEKSQGKKMVTFSRRSTLARSNSRQPDFPTLALTSAQFAMIKALEDIGFRRYPVYIHQVRHSHAAIIVRMPRKGFAEGTVVVKHWLENEFKI